MSLSHSPAIVTDGLVLCLDAASQKSYPKSGTVWTNLAGPENGTLVNMTNNFNSESAGVLVFDGSNEYISTTFSYANNDDFTMSFWMKTDGTGNQLAGLVGFRRKYRATDWYQSQFYITGDAAASVAGASLKYDSFNRTSPTFRSQVEIFLTDSEDSVTTGTWKQITVSSHSTGAIVYIDGQEKGSDSATPPATRFDEVGLMIGVANNYPDGPLGGYYFDGSISLVSFYNRALSADEIRQNYLATRGRYK